MGVTEEVWTKKDFVDLARRQQHFLWTMLAIFVVNTLMVVPAIRAALGGLPTVVLSLGVLYIVYKLMAAVLPASSTGLIVAYFVLSLFPFINLLLLAYLNNLAAQRLRVSGVNAGFFGTKMADVEHLPEDFTVAIAV
jgi:hypothetical protein